MKLATAAYPMDFLPDWQAFETKLEAWVREAAEAGAKLLVFPEYGAMELATLDGRAVALDLQASIRAVSARLPDVDALHAQLAERYGVHILAASAPMEVGEGLPVNRARLFAPGGKVGVVDKQIMTRFERDDWFIRGGAPLEVFQTELGRIGVLICYDSEFPLLGRALHEADILLTPSCTESLAGYWRVRIGSMARALENQCVVAMASTVGTCDWSESVDVNRGAGGVFCPPDRGFEPTGVISVGALDKPGWTYAEVDLDAVAEVRRDGVVLNRLHWQEQDGRDTQAALTDLT